MKRAFLQALAMMFIFASSIAALPYVGLSYDPLEITASLNSYGGPNLLGIYVLAFDHEPGSAHNVAPQFDNTLQGIMESTAGNKNKKAVILADLDDVGDTKILVVQNGITSTVAFNDVFTTPASNNEYDMTDGTTLGEFLIWAFDQRPNNGNPTKTIFSYIGHGAPVTPETNTAEIFAGNQRRSAEDEDTLLPMPGIFDVHPAFTDHHAIPDGNDFKPSTISPHDLAFALNMAQPSYGGANLDVLDLVHCFALSIEEVYELSNPGGTPFAKTITGSPNYTYFGFEMPGEVLATIDANDSAQDMASTVIATYNQVIIDNEREPGIHPRLMVALDSSLIQPIKDAWDSVSNNLLSEFNNNPSLARQRVSDAYTASAKYDTTFHTEEGEVQDFELAAPDALSDLSDFADKLAGEFSDKPGLVASLNNTKLAVNAATISRTATNGEPWFASDPKPTWNFDNHVAGIALYTDFEGEVIDGTTHLSWQARWYTDEVFTAPNGTGNPHPYRFVQHTQWDELFLKFWENELPNLQTLAALPVLPQAGFSEAGDSNGDRRLSAGDLSALVRELFDGDGEHWLDAPGGTFPGDPVGSDANRNNVITAADLSCTVRLIFGQSCSSRRPSTVPGSEALLSLPEQIEASAGSSVTIPISLSTEGNHVSSLVASIDYDERWLSVDPTDSDSDGIPDAISFNVPAGFQISARFDPTDTSGEIDLMIMDISVPLNAIPEGSVVSITFDVGHPTASTEATLNFSDNPAPSLGDTFGQDVLVRTEQGSVQIVASEDSQPSQLFLPIILR